LAARGIVQGVRRTALVMVVLALAALAARLALAPSPRDELLSGKVVRLSLTIPAEGVASLSREPRTPVKAVLEEPGHGRWEQVTVRLRGNSSFRPIEDARPGFTVRVDGDSGGYRGLRRFSLNNSVQDPTLLNELLGGEMARAAGIPASRCTLVLLTVNGRARGTYLLKEGFDREFLGRFHRDPDGPLFDGGLHNDIHPGLEVDRDGGGRAKVALASFSDALREPDPARRRERLERVLDIDGYLRHLAVENLLVHMDGYSYRANNYRAYQDPSTGRFSFVLHGMDNLFGHDAWGQSHPRGYVLSVPGVAPLYPDASVTAVAQALWSLPPEADIRGRFRRLAAQTHAAVFRDADWPGRAEARIAELGRQLAALDPEEGAAFVERSGDYLRKLRGRLEVVDAQFADVERLAAPGRGAVDLGAYAWSPSAESAEASEREARGRRVLALKVTGGKADFRLPLSLEPGAYRLTATVRTAGLKAAAFRGRLSGRDPSAVPAVEADADWRPHACLLEVGEGDTTLVLELRGEAGRAWVDLAGLRLERLR
jgi:spore coat protein H